MSDRAVLAITGAVILTLLIALVTTVQGAMYYSGRASCRNWGHQANRETTFRHLTEPLGVPLTWDCFTPVGNGRWLPISRVREFDP
jgi:hypothetical protein